MKKLDINRRDFARWSMAALGGLVAGSMAGCGGREEPAGADAGGDANAEANEPMTEAHACRGLNSCKGLGASGDNDCAGQGTCATVAHHECGGLNECKGLGGCGENPGTNECKGQGGCAIPMTHGDAWERARAAFEERMAAAGKAFGEAPPRE